MIQGLNLDQTNQPALSNFEILSSNQKSKPLNPNANDDRYSGSVEAPDAENYSPEEINERSHQKDVKSLLELGDHKSLKKIADILMKHYPEGIKDVENILKKLAPNSPENSISKNLEGLIEGGGSNLIKPYIDNLSNKETDKDINNFMSLVDEMSKAHKNLKDNQPVSVDSNTGIYDVNSPNNVIRDNSSLRIEMNFNLFFSLSEEVRSRYGSDTEGQFHEVTRSVAGRFDMNFSLRIESIGKFLNANKDVIDYMPESYKQFIDAASGLSDLNKDALDHFVEATNKFMNDLKDVYGHDETFDSMKNSIIGSAKSFVEEVHKGVNEVFPEIYQTRMPIDASKNSKADSLPHLQKDLPSLLDMVRRLVSDNSVLDSKTKNRDILNESMTRMKEIMAENLKAIRTQSPDLVLA